MIKTISTSYKTEGTSQTYGQVVVLREKNSNFFREREISSTKILSPDKIVKLNPVGGATQLKSSDVDDNEFSKIAAAAALQVNPSVDIDASKDTGANNQTISNPASINVSLTMPNIQEFAVVLGSSVKTAQDIAKSMEQSIKIDSALSMKSQFSEEIELNNLKEINVESNFVYNFYIPEEEDIISQEDQNKDPLLLRDKFNVPRYVELSWNPTILSEPISYENDSEEAFFFKKQTFLKKNSGVVSYNSYSHKNSYLKSASRTFPVTLEGNKVNIVDLNQTDKAFDNIVNGKTFTNTINVVLEPARSTLGKTAIPLKSKNTGMWGSR